MPLALEAQVAREKQAHQGVVRAITLSPGLPMPARGQFLPTTHRETYAHAVPDEQVLVVTLPVVARVNRS